MSLSHVKCVCFCGQGFVHSDVWPMYVCMVPFFVEANLQPPSLVVVGAKTSTVALLKNCITLMGQMTLVLTFLWGEVAAK